MYRTQKSICVCTDHGDTCATLPFFVSLRFQAEIRRLWALTSPTASDSLASFLMILGWFFRSTTAAPLQKYLPTRLSEISCMWCIKWRFYHSGSSITSAMKSKQSEIHHRSSGRSSWTNPATPLLPKPTTPQTHGHLDGSKRSIWTSGLAIWHLPMVRL